MTRTTLFCLLFVSLAFTFSATPGFAMEIPYEKYQLDNGMTVILHEDHSLPVVAVNLWYRVGSKDEPVRRSGFAHLFEHLMFMGTERVPGNQFDVIMESGGGSNNATTSSDRTNYFSSGPARLLPTLLWLEADRLEDLARTMTQEKLDTQREVVRNERRQSYENRPYGQSELVIQGMMYPVGHPYHIPVIGTHEDLEAATVGDVKGFFATYYVPNNVSLCVAGDFDRAATKKLIADLFGSLPRGGAPERRTAEPVTLGGVKRATLVDKVQAPLVAMSWHSPALYAEGDAECDLLGSVLSDGKTSRLYKRLVYEDKIATEVSAYQASEQLGSTFRVDVLAAPGVPLERIEQAVDEEIARLVEAGPTEAELERQKAANELQMLSRLQSVEAKADRLNGYEYYLGEPDSFDFDLGRYRAVSPAGVQAWARRVLDPGRRVIVRVLPEAPPRAKTARDAQPELGADPAFEPTAPRAFTLSNGLPVQLWTKSELPLVAMTMLFKPGRPLVGPERAGLALLTADMLDEGAGERDALAFGDAMHDLGARLSSNVDHHSVVVSVFGLKRNIGEAAKLYADAIRRPRMTAEDWERVKRLHLEDLKQEEDSPRTVARNVSRRVLFGDASPYAWPVGGTPETVEDLSLEQVKALHAQVLSPKSATLLVSGDLSVDEAKPLLEELFGDWKPAEVDAGAAPATPAMPTREKLAVVIVDRPEAVQTVIRFILPGPRFADERRVRLRLLNTLLGGSFTSRLNQNLREEHGYTYGAGSAFVMEPTHGSFIASSSVRADVTGESVKEFLLELRGIRAGDVKPEEVAKARETVRTEVIETFSGLSGVVGATAELIVNDLPFETIARDMAALGGVDAAALNAIVNDAIPLEQGALVLVGDKGEIVKQLEGLGLGEPIELDVRGAPKK